MVCLRHGDIRTGQPATMLAISPWSMPGITIMASARATTTMRVLIPMSMNILYPTTMMPTIAQPVAT